MKILPIYAFCFFAALLPSSAVAGPTPFQDDFEDGDATDGKPVSWQLSADGLAAGGTGVLPGRNMNRFHADLLERFKPSTESWRYENCHTCDLAPILTHLRYIRAAKGDSLPAAIRRHEREPVCRAKELQE